MEEKGNFPRTVKPDRYFTATRIAFCQNKGCRFFDAKTYGCSLKEIAVDKEGKCKNVEAGNEGSYAGNR